MYKISFFVPENNAEIVKTAMFNAGAGKIGSYDQCSFQTLGSGQFRALPGSNPYIGEIHKLEKVIELKVEMVCRDEIINDVVLALKNNHPYEMPAYDVIKLEDF